jgi:outer membrane lipoprotein-sorting protein
MLFSVAAGAQAPASPPQTSPDAKANLQRVIALIDHTAASFRAAQANFVWRQYNRVVDETDIQKGTVYFRRSGNQVEMAADINDPPPPEQVRFTGSKLQLYRPKINEVTEYNTGKDRAAVESFLVLGFGGSGQDMLKSYDVTYLGAEKVDNIDTAKLDLVPKSEKARTIFTHIWLWIDLARGVSIQQQLFQPDGDNRLATYSEIQLKDKIPDSAFKLKTTEATKFLSPKG